MRQAGRERVLTTAICRADGRNELVVHLIVTRLATILERFDSLAPSICEDARIVAVTVVAWMALVGGLCDTSGSELLKAS